MSERQKGLEPLEVTIEPARPEDVLAMANLRYKNIVHRASQLQTQLRPHERRESEYMSDDVEKILNEMLKPDNFFLCAKNKDGNVVGMCGLIWKAEMSRFQFVYFFVDPKVHRRGVGEKLYKTMSKIAEASVHSPNGLFLYTKVDNSVARKMYREKGFRETDPKEWMEHKYDDGTKDNFVKMTLDFSP